MLNVSAPGKPWSSKPQRVVSMNTPDRSSTLLQGRRLFLRSGLSLSFAGLAGKSLVGSKVDAAQACQAVNKVIQRERNDLSPDEVVDLLLEGNRRFRHHQGHFHNYLREQREVGTCGQHPLAVVLSCIDSRAPAEIVMDQGISRLFNARVAGNVSNTDLLGSIEFACRLAGAKVIMVMGHTRCGAIQGAIRNGPTGDLTQLAALLAKIRPAIDRTSYAGDRSPSNYAFVDAVAETNVRIVMEEIRRQSPPLNQLAETGAIRIVGSMYDIDNGKLRLIA